MSLIQSSASGFKTELSSSGTGVDGGWRRWWATEAQRSGTDWSSLHQQHVEAWRRIRSLAESSSGAVP